MVRNDGENLVFLLCLPRSGSTVLSLLLGNHSKVDSPPEPWILLKLNAILKERHSSSIYDDKLATLASAAFLQRSSFIEAARSFAVSSYNNHVHKSGKSIFVDKTPRYYHILPFIDEMFPKARKIWLKRNPLDVASSYKNSWGIGIDIITGRTLSAASYDFTVGLFNLASYFAAPSRYKFVLEYETLVSSSVRTLRNLCKFLGLSFEKKMLDYEENQELISQHRSSILGDKGALDNTTIHTQSVGTWKEILSLSEMQQLVDLIGFEIIRDLGYSETLRVMQRLGVTTPSESGAAEARLTIAEAKSDDLGGFEREASVRLEEMHEKEREITKLSSEAKQRLDELHTLTKALEREKGETALLRQAMEEIQHEMKGKEQENKKLSQAAEERRIEMQKMAKAIEEKEHEINKVSQEASIRLGEMQKMAKAIEEKEHEINKVSQEASIRLGEMQVMAKALQQKEKEILNLKSTAEKRLHAIKEKE